MAFVGGAVWLSTIPWSGAEASAFTLPAILQQATVICLAWVIVSLRTNFYQPRRTDTLTGELKDLFEAWLVTLASGSLLVHVVWGGISFQPLLTFVVALVAISLVRIALRVGLRRLRDRGWNFREVILVGRGKMSHNIAELAADRPHFGIRIVGSFRLPGEDGPAPCGVEDLGEVGRLAHVISDREVESVLLCPDLKVRTEEMHRVLEKCDIAGIRCFYMPEFLHLHNLTAETTTFGGLPGFTFNPCLGSPIQLALKRGMDVLGATIGLVLFSPIFLAVALAVKLYDRGPLFFGQLRMGKDGRRFYCYKFRSMCVDAESQRAALADRNEQDGPVFKVERDPRITPVGRFLRKYSLDELPQLWNVLKGDMSLVGPRPPVPSEVAEYSWWQRRRISVRPGLTCLWQVKGRNKVSFEKWMEMDLFYIDNWSLWMDIKLLAQTMPAVVRGTGM